LFNKGATMRSHERPSSAPLSSGDDLCNPPANSTEPPEQPDEDDDFDDGSRDDNLDDSCWDVFIPDDDERDPLPEAGDFWTSRERGALSEEPD
jgi:hypothetical protein